MTVHELPYALREYNAWIRLVKGSRKRAHEYRHWAMQAAEEGRPDLFKRYRDFSTNSWNQAKDALFRARMMRRHF